MKGVIHQAYFLPWLGYFSKLAISDIFVVLDDVNFRKRHYIDRTRIIDMHGNVKWLGLPVGDKFKYKCFDVYVKDSKSFQRIEDNLRHSYRKAKYYNQVSDEIFSLLDSVFSLEKDIVHMNMELIIGLMKILGIKPPKVVYSSQMDVSNDATQRVVDICNQACINELILGKGKSLDVHNVKLLENENITILIQDFNKYHPVYSQLRRRDKGFAKGLSVIDMLFNEGIENTNRAINLTSVELERFHSDHMLLDGEG